LREVEINPVFIGPMDENGRITPIIDQIKDKGPLRRQDLAPEYTMNGALYLFKWDFFKKYKSIFYDRYKTFGYVMEPHYSIEIDQMIDLHWVEYLINSGHVDMSYWK